MPKVWLGGQVKCSRRLYIFWCVWHQSNPMTSFRPLLLKVLCLVLCGVWSGLDQSGLLWPGWVSPAFVCVCGVGMVWVTLVLHGPVVSERCRYSVGMNTFSVCAVYTFEGKEGSCLLCCRPEGRARYAMCIVWWRRWQDCLLLLGSAAQVSPAGWRQDSHPGETADPPSHSFPPNLLSVFYTGTDWR